MMFKRNDGYALSYVLVVLMVLAIIATAVMAPPLRNLQMQQASIERMQEKYAAQGMVEQVVAQLGTTSDISVFSLPSEYNDLIIENDSCSFKAIKGNTTINVTLNLTPKLNAEGATIGYTTTYESYSISYSTEVGS